MQKSVEKTAQELQDVKDKCEELRGAKQVSHGFVYIVTRLTDLGMFSLLKQDAVRELLTLQEQQRAELRIINNALLEETGARENLERRLCELRTEVKNGFIRNIEIDFCISAIVL